MSRFDYSPATSGIVHSIAAYTGVEWDVINKDDLPDGPENTQSYVWPNGSGYAYFTSPLKGEDLSAFLPGLGYYYMQTPGGSLRAKVYAQIDKIPVPSDYIGTSYGSKAASEQAVQRWFDAVDAYYEGIDNAVFTRLELYKSGALLGNFQFERATFDTPVSSLLDGNDLVTGSRYDDILLGEGGDDEIRGGEGIDDISGGLGNDNLIGDAGADIIRGGGGDDILSGSGLRGAPPDAGGNRLYGDDGNDILYGWNVSDGTNATYAPDELHGGSGVDTFYADTSPDAPDVVMDFELGEKAYSGTYADPTRYAVLSSNEGTKVNFFESSGGPKVASFQFDTRILPQFLNVSAQGNALIVSYENSLAAQSAQIAKLVQALQPIIDVGVNTIVELLKTALLEKGADFAAKKVLPLVERFILNNDTAVNAVVAVLDKFNAVFDGKLTPTQFENLSHKLLSNVGQLVADLSLKKIAAPDQDVSINPYEALKIITLPLQIVSPFYNGVVKLSDYIQLSVVSAIDFKFAKDEADLIINLPDTDEGSLKPQTVSHDNGKFSFVPQSAPIDESLGSDQSNDTIYAAHDRIVLPSNVENAVQLRGAGSADAQSPSAGSLSPATGETELVGNDLDNSLTGSDRASHMSGGAGADLIFGQGGRDVLDGGRGDDLLDGGAGFDVASYVGNGSADGFRHLFAVTGGHASGVTVAGIGLGAAAHGTDTLQSIEQLNFTDGRLVYDAADPAAVVLRMYDAMFGRAPDAGGFNYWISTLQSGAPAQSMAESFAASTEFRTTYGNLSNQGFVEQLYRNVLDREGDAGGVSYWTGQLNGGSTSRGQVLLGFSESVEHAAKLQPIVDAGLWDLDETAAQAARVYSAAFDRAPDAGGLAFWTNALKSSGLAPASMADQFVQSGEFSGRYGPLTNDQFVDQLYLNVLDRGADAGGLAFWTGALNNGSLDRGDVLFGFSESAENVAKTMPTMTDGILLA